MYTKIYAQASKIFFLFSFFYFLNTNAQAPDKMSYQAVIRNATNTLVANQGVGMKISILQGTATGTEVYKELFNPNPTTNANGLVSLVIGTGIPLTGTFATINWENGPYFIKTETDPTGGTNYTITSTTQLMSVPFALNSKFAKYADNGSENVGMWAGGISGSHQVNGFNWVTVKWLNVQEDGGTNYNAATGEYTITKAGVYQINAHCVVDGFTNGNNTSFIGININNTLPQSYGYLSGVGNNPINGYSIPSISMAKRFAVGDIIKIQLAIESGSANYGQVDTPPSFSVAFLHK